MGAAHLTCEYCAPSLVQRVKGAISIMGEANERGSRLRTPKPIERFVSRGSVFSDMRALDACKAGPSRSSAGKKAEDGEAKRLVCAQPAAHRAKDASGGCTAPKCKGGADCLSRAHGERAIGWQLDVYWAPGEATRRPLRRLVGLLQGAALAPALRAAPARARAPSSQR